MIKKIILAFLTATILISSTLVCGVDLNKKFNLTNNKLNDTPKTIATNDGIIILCNIKNQSKEYYESVYEKIFTKTNKNYNLSLGLATGTSTVFQPPFSGCFSWGEKTPGVNEYSHGCNSYSGGVGAYANAFIGGATAEAMQRLDFYIGRQKTLSVDAEIIRTGGKLTFGFGSFAGTEKTWSWDDFQENYHRSDVDPWWNWDIIIFKIIGIVSLIVGVTPNNIAEAILLINEIFDFDELLNQLQEMLEDGNAEILNIKFSITLNQGYHRIWTGLRATASACITGTGSAVTMGQVSKITIDGIAPPDSPTLDGKSSVKVNEVYCLNAKSIDPNNDKIMYYIEWGDGTNSGWTEFKPSGTNIECSHKYSKKGTFKIKVLVKDIDRMESESIKTIDVNGGNNKIIPRLTPRILNKFILFFILTYI